MLQDWKLSAPFWGFRSIWRGAFSEGQKSFVKIIIFLLGRFGPLYPPMSPVVTYFCGRHIFLFMLQVNNSLSLTEPITDHRLQESVGVCRYYYTIPKNIGRNFLRFFKLSFGRKVGEQDVVINNPVFFSVDRHLILNSVYLLLKTFFLLNLPLPLWQHC